jgi:hypothetical protein
MKRKPRFDKSERDSVWAIFIAVTLDPHISACLKKP